MRDYKLKFYNEMPDQSANNMARLNAFQEQYQGKQESIQDLERTRVLVRDQISGRRQVLKTQADGFREPTFNKETSPLLSKQEQLERQQVRLNALQGRYTDQHPKIKRIKRRIAQLELEQKAIATKDGQVTPKQSRQVSWKKQDKALFELNSQLKGIALDIEKINKEKEELQFTIDKYEKRVAATPFREAEWAAIT